MACPPRMIGCRTDCLHRAMVEDYRAARERCELALELETHGYAADRALALEHGAQLVTFRAWLEQLAGQQAYARYPDAPEQVAS